MVKREDTGEGTATVKSLHTVRLNYNEGILEKMKSLDPQKALLYEAVLCLAKRQIARRVYTARFVV